MDRYSFIVSDSYRLLLVGLPAHSEPSIDIGHERLSAHGSVDHHWRGHLIVTQRVDEGDGLPAPNETRPISLTPRGARLLSRTMLVLAAVSSMLRLTLCLR